MVGLNLFTDGELSNLNRYASNTLVPKSYDELSAEKKETFVQRAARINPQLTTTEEIQEEAVAEMYRAWSKNNKSINGQPRSLLQRILDFFTGIIDGLKGAGFNPAETYDSIALSISEGEIGKRKNNEDVVETIVGAIEEGEKEVPDDEEDRTIGVATEKLFTDREKSGLESLR